MAWFFSKNFYTKNMARTKKTTSKSKQTQQNINFSSISIENQNRIFGIIFIILALLVFFSTQEQVDQELPILWKWLKIAFSWLFGEYFNFIFSPILIIFGFFLLLQKKDWSPLRWIGLLGFFASVVSLIGWYDRGYLAFFNIFPSLLGMIGEANSIIFFVVIFFVSLWAIFSFSYRDLFFKAKENISQITNISMKIPKIEIDDYEDDYEEKPIKTVEQKKKKLETELETVQNTIQTQKIKLEQKVEEKPKKIFSFAKNDENSTKIKITDTKWNILTKPKEKTEVTRSISNEKWDFPSTQLLNKPYKKNIISPEEIREKALIIQKTLLQFGIEVEIEEECIGPTVTQYRIRPAEGVRVSKIENLKKDLTLALSAKSIRIQAPIPGMNLIGIEVPNEKRDIVGIREIIEDHSFVNHKSKLALTMGKDINGDYVVGDLEKMPHLLIAGQTGSGKSVGMNSFIISMLYKNSPFDLRMIMIDPKQVELGMYDGIPHLLTPVISTPDKALNILRWSVAEMERRYSLFKWKAKKLSEWNERYPSEKISTIVIIIDELADLMMSGNKKEVETLITRIAQKARAVGIHLILATQRPSVDVITGLIKANVPSRVAFTVASQVDSRTILDQVGAEDLLGYGDMMYFPTGSMFPIRAQWVLIETEEIENVVRHIRLAIPEDGYPETLSAEDIAGSESSNFDWSIMDRSGLKEDPQVIDEAIRIVREQWKCSKSMLQTYMWVGYNRAAKIVSILEEMWVIGPSNGAKWHDVL